MPGPNPAGQNGNFQNCNQKIRNFGSLRQILPAVYIGRRFLANVNAPLGQKGHVNSSTYHEL